MSTLTIYTGHRKPLHAVGRNQCRLLEFAHNCQGSWHTYATDRATLRAVNGLERRGSIVVDRESNLFRIRTED